MFHHCYGQPKRLDLNFLAHLVLTTRFRPTCFLLTEKNRFCSEWLQHECTRSLQQHSTVRKITVLKFIVKNLKKYIIFHQIFLRKGSGKSKKRKNWL